MKETPQAGPCAEIVSLPALPSRLPLDRRAFVRSFAGRRIRLSVTGRNSNGSAWDYAQCPVVQFEFFIVSGGKRRSICTVSFPPGM
jgi:hypothetical protein